MKKIYSLIITIIICFNVIGCRIYSELKEIDGFKHDCRIFSEYIVNEDRDAMYDMFCDKFKDTEDFKNDLDKVLDLLFSYEFDYSDMAYDSESGGGSSYRDGELTEWSTTGNMRNIYDSEGNEYCIWFGYHGIDMDKPEMEGVTSLALLSVIDSGQGYDNYEMLLYVGNYQSNIVQRHEGQDGFFFL